MSKNDKMIYLRDKIDTIDDKITDLLVKRFNIVKEIGTLMERLQIAVEQGGKPINERTGKIVSDEDMKNMWRRSIKLSSKYYKFDFTIRKESLGISLVEPFLKGGYRSMITDLEGPSFSQYSEYRYLIRSVGISFKYTFGKLNFKNRKTNSKIKNDDLQKNESNQNN